MVFSAEPNIADEWKNFFSGLGHYLVTMPTFHYLTIATWVCTTVLIGFALRARCWFLLVGWLASLAVTSEILIRLFSGFLGFHQEWKPSPPIALLNQILGFIELSFVTTGFILLLSRQSKFQPKSGG